MTTRYFLTAGLVVACFGVGQTAIAADMRMHAAPKAGYTVALPTTCKQLAGPGYRRAVCAGHGGTARGEAGALVLEISHERVPADDGLSLADLAQRYSFPQFEADGPGFVCGEVDRRRIRFANAFQMFEPGRIVYLANVVCPPVRFLNLSARSATVRFIIAPGWRYRLMARAPTVRFAQARTVIDAFFASFQLSKRPRK